MGGPQSSAMVMDETDDIGDRLNVLANEKQQAMPTKMPNAATAERSAQHDQTVRGKQDWTSGKDFSIQQQINEIQQNQQMMENDYNGNNSNNNENNQ